MVTIIQEFCQKHKRIMPTFLTTLGHCVIFHCKLCHSQKIAVYMETM